MADDLENDDSPVTICGAEAELRAAAWRRAVAEGDIAPEEQPHS